MTFSHLAFEHIGTHTYIYSVHKYKVQTHGQKSGFSVNYFPLLNPLDFLFVVV